MKLLAFNLFFALSVSLSSVTAVTVKCDYQKWFGWSQVKHDIYYCDATNERDFSGSSVTIDGKEGVHKPGKTNNDVNGFKVFSSKSPKFPGNLASVFENLELISITDSKLAEITSDDLAFFTNLKYLILDNNEIKVLRADVFANNPDLEMVILSENKIEHIDGTTFSRLSKLRVLDLACNPCGSLDYYNGKSDIDAIVKKIEQSECQSDIFRA